MRVRLSTLVVGSDHPRGCDMAHVMRLARMISLDTRALDVRPLPCGHMEILNGRHRYLAAQIRGDEFINVRLRH